MSAKAKTRAKSGFTMIEMIFVIILLGLLSAIAAGKIFAAKEDAQAVALASQVQQVLKDLQAYYITNGNLNNELAAMTDMPYLQIYKDQSVQEEVKQAMQSAGWIALYSNGLDGIMHVSYSGSYVGTSCYYTTGMYGSRVCRPGGRVYSSSYGSFRANEELPAFGDKTYWHSDGTSSHSSTKPNYREMVPRLIFLVKNGADNPAYPCISIDFINITPGRVQAYGSSAVTVSHADGLRLIALKYDYEKSGKPNERDYAVPRACKKLQGQLQGLTGPVMDGQRMQRFAYSRLFSDGWQPPTWVSWKVNSYGVWRGEWRDEQVQYSTRAVVSSKEGALAGNNINLSGGGALME